MASLRRAALTGVILSGIHAGLLAMPAGAFEVVKLGGPVARVLFLGLGSTERACGSIRLPEGEAVLIYDPWDHGCGAYDQLVVLVRAPFGKGMAFMGELCSAIMSDGSVLTLHPTGRTEPGAPEITCSLENPER